MSDDYRSEFRMDCVFGMPGVSMDRTRLVQGADGKFIDTRNERTFQVWLRGVAHNRLEVRRHFERLIRMAHDAKAQGLETTLRGQLADLQAAGLAALDAGG